MWAHFWPLVVIALAVGFLLTAVFMRIIWFMIPAIIIGINGLLFQFCALTGLWQSWAILWTLEPLAVGLALLAASGGHRRGLATAGFTLLTISLAAFSLMSFILSGWVSIVGALALILGGVFLLARGRIALPLEKPTKEKLYDVA